VLVLNTLGVNVWCAAGKGTFGTRELINRINSVKLREIVSHRTLILPQLGAPGMEAHKIAKDTGFKVIYGPVRAGDIPRFLDKGLRADKEMRRVKFAMAERLEVAWLELIHSLKLVIIFFLFFGAYNLIGRNMGLGDAAVRTLLNTLAYVISIIIGTLLVPVLLPYLPFRSFSLKGAAMGILWSIILIGSSSLFGFDGTTLTYAANTLITTALVSFLALNFTGSSTYTSLSGVQRETLYSVPAMALGAIAGVVIFIIQKIMMLIS